ncbi:hypothetical protein CSB92_5997 [Pseudomonas aeruginosa]|nr:hypothetical protein CSB94_4889 [Pseudomonas aeruginosa]EFQ41560.1 hypothetical protein PA39016_002430001 [Pseudomonas aeruginosa 39016]AVK22423.1 hypothetical protein CSB90_3069 [Pseudomonas aeruginosa]AWF65692.1 hypothetical protein CSC27_2734 [Pseudomonas aeruginosa]PRW16646.1 hypothetical protein CSB92_5997 [Pseudomonas aeruginosa]
MKAASRDARRCFPLELSGASCRRLAPTNYEVPGSAISFLPVFYEIRIVEF